MATAVTVEKHSAQSHIGKPIGHGAEVTLLLLLARDSGDATARTLARISGIPLDSARVALGRLRRHGMVVTQRVKRPAADGRLLNFAVMALTGPGARLARGLIRLRREIGPSLWGRMGFPNLSIR